MPRFADPHRCPSCAGAILGPTCPACGLRLVGPTAGELFRTLQHADTLLEQLRAESVVAPPVLTPKRVTSVSAASVEVREVREVREVPAPPPTPRRGATVPAVLLTLGGISLASGALIFLVIAWFLLGVGGRTAALAVLTCGFGAVAWLAARRDLRAAAETLGTLTALFAGFDLVGARLAWFDGSDLRPYAVAAGLVLAAGCGCGVVALRPWARLRGPEVIGTIGLVVAAVAVLGTEHHLPVAMGTVMLAGVAGAATARRAGLWVLAVGALVLGVIGWLLLVVYGAFSAVEHHAAPSAIGPLATAGVAAIAVAVALPPARAVAGTIGTWLLLGAAVGWAEWFQTPTGGLATVAGVSAAGYAAGYPVWAGPWRRAGIGVGLTGTVVLLTAATAWTGELATAIVRAGAHGWGTRFVPDGNVPPWSALVGVGLLAALGLHVRGRRLHPSLATAGIVAVGLTGAGYAPWTLFPAGSVLAAAGLEAAIALRGERRHWFTAGVLLAAAWAGAGVGAGPESVVWWAAAVLGGVVLRGQRTPERVVAAALTPPCLAGALLLDAAALDLERRWAALATLLLVYGAALALRPRAARPVRGVGSALAAGTLVAMLAAAGFGAASAGWLAAELTVVAAGCAVAGILDRSRIEGVVATGTGLVALWLRLGASDVHTPEAYSLPLAAAVLLVGGWSLHRDSSRRTVPTLGTGLALALVPTWALGVAHPLGSRALIAGLASVLLVAVGAQLRWMAPLLLGAATGAVLALVEVAPYAQAVPRWVLLVSIGACLLAAGIRWEALAAAGRRTWGRVAELR